jgi:hypothetical protein
MILDVSSFRTSTLPIEVQQYLNFWVFLKSRARKNSRAPLEVSCSLTNMGFSSLVLKPRCLACSRDLFLKLKSFTLFRKSYLSIADLNAIIIVGVFSLSPLDFKRNISLISPPFILI